MTDRYGSEWDFFKNTWEADHHATLLFPDDTNLTCTLTAHANANTWSAWTEIQDSGTTTLSSKFASYDGHIVAMIIEALSQINTIYMVELSHGASNMICTRWRLAGATKFQHPGHQLRVRGTHIPTGETVYYRMKTATAVADTALVHFRYYLHT